MRPTRRGFLATLAASAAPLPEPALAAEWQRIAAATNGSVGAAALHLESGRRTSLHGSDAFPMASVCKLPIAMHFLALADEGKVSLGDSIEILPQDIIPWVSEVVRRWPAQKKFPLDQLLEWMVAESDNTAVQALFRLAGGGVPLTNRLRQWKVEGMRLDRSEGRCFLDAAGVTNVPPVEQWTGDVFHKLTAGLPRATRREGLRRFLADPRDTSTPDAAVTLLARAFRGELLSAPKTRCLEEILRATRTGPKRIRGRLPAGTVVAHKTGTVSTVVNDAGVIELPGRAGRLAVAVFIKGSTRDTEVDEAVIAQIARAAFDTYSAGSPPSSSSPSSSSGSVAKRFKTRTAFADVNPAPRSRR